MNSRHISLPSDRQADPPPQEEQIQPPIVDTPQPEPPSKRSDPPLDPFYDLLARQRAGKRRVMPIVRLDEDPRYTGENPG
jgi:hypothetical protein